ncbi:cation transporting ATPase C-terminal domain-containing protein, partial [[Eubacterium] cellulosolvens]
SVVSASLIVLVIRSRRPLFRSTPGRYLFTATMLIVGATLILPFTPVGKLFGFSPLPLSFLAAMGTVVVLYIVAAEAAKRVFYSRVKS